MIKVTLYLSFMKVSSLKQLLKTFPTMRSALASLISINHTLSHLTPSFPQYTPSPHPPLNTHPHTTLNTPHSLLPSTLTPNSLLPSIHTLTPHSLNTPSHHTPSFHPHTTLPPSLDTPSHPPSLNTHPHSPQCTPSHHTLSSPGGKIQPFHLG